MQDKQAKKEVEEAGMKYVFDELEDLKLQLGYDPSMDFVTLRTVLTNEYTRTIRIPASQYVLGEVFKDECEYNLVRGKLEIFDAQEGSITRLVAPSAGKFKAGSRRLYYARQASELITVHTTMGNTISEAEKELLAH